MKNKISRQEGRRRYSHLMQTAESARSLLLRMAFSSMDAWTWGENRIDRRRTQVIRPGGKLDSFCRYYPGLADASTRLP